ACLTRRNEAMTLVSAAPVLVSAIGGYLLGSVPVAVLVGRAHGLDPREAGDRNPGFWNMMEQLGRRAAVPVFAGDLLKGTLAGLARSEERRVGEEWRAWWPPEC